VIILKRLFALVTVLLLAACTSASDSNSEFSANDQMFAQMMIPHHEQAIEMSKLALAISKDSEVLQLAEQIESAQGPEIEQMKSWGASDSDHAGHAMDGMLSDSEMEELTKATGSEFDRLFLEGMIKHHEGAIEMAQMVLDSDNAKAAKLGKEIVRTQQAEINQMQDLLNR
jgi:uncharacterized protein (DUF305 family)